MFQKLHCMHKSHHFQPQNPEQEMINRSIYVSINSIYKIIIQLKQIGHLIFSRNSTNIKTIILKMNVHEHERQETEQLQLETISDNLEHLLLPADDLTSMSKS